MGCEIEFTDEFYDWFSKLSEQEQDTVDAVVGLLEAEGTNLRHPYSSAIAGSRYGHMRELRIQHQGRPLRILYAFDPRRIAILLIGGDKTGHDRWYDEYVPKADRIYDAHLRTLEREGLR